MGLLDDAIREHLELKRLGGADPGQVAREEQDALGPVLRAGKGAQSVGEPSRASDSGGQLSSAGGEATQHVDTQKPGQETVEINMEAELSAAGDSDGVFSLPNAERAAPVAHPAHAPNVPEESLEWEVPGEVPPELSPSAHEGDQTLGDDGEHVEDVLEETPDFLRDTPEQERLWFEQRPPRDFDFNE